MNYTRFSRTGKEQQTLLFFERSRGNSQGEIPPVFSILAIPISYTIYTMKKVVTMDFSYTSAMKRHESRGAFVIGLFSHDCNFGTQSFPKSLVIFKHRTLLSLRKKKMFRLIVSNAKFQPFSKHCKELFQFSRAQSNINDWVIRTVINRVE